MPEFTMTIGGRSVSASSAFGVVNPATGEEAAHAPDCSPEQLDQAMAAAAAARRAWSADIDTRRKALHAAADVLMSHAGELAAVLTTEQGKPIPNARSEVMSSGYWLKHFADLEIPRQAGEDDGKASAVIVRRPVGPVAAITSWTFPLALAAWKIGPALLAGNTMVLKPSPYTPLSTLRMGELLRDVLPAGVLNVVSGGDELGARMTAHPVPRKISFTGSVATGKRVAAAAALGLKRVTLELGGSAPAILLDDVDPAGVADRIFDAAFRNNGQWCSALKRVYVPRALYGEVVEALAGRARSAVVGNGADPGVRFGPVNNRPAFDRVAELVTDALRGGARAAAGGKPIDRPGYFYEPTVLADVDDSSRIVAEEQFGPALPVVAYAEPADAVDRANATRFFSGSVWSADPERAAHMAGQLECGTAWINAHGLLAPHVPASGLEWRAAGVESGIWGVYESTEIQVLHQARV
ncbi:aldehyde dehydrogenase family protein [Streptomyces sp. NPDC002537]